MTYTSIRTAAIVAALLGATAASASSDKAAPTAAQKAAIEASLKDGGFSTWQTVTTDGTGWKVDNATGADGKVYDLKLDKTSYAILARQPDAGAVPNK